jgi:hypothetical protein
VFWQVFLLGLYSYNNSYPQNYVNNNKIVIDSLYNNDTTSMNQDFNYSRIDSFTCGNNSTGSVIENNFLKSETYSNYTNQEINDYQNKNTIYSSRSTEF